MDESKSVVLDTSVLIEFPEIVTLYEKPIILSCVFEELDNLAHDKKKGSIVKKAIKEIIKNKDNIVFIDSTSTETKTDNIILDLCKKNNAKLITCDAGMVLKAEQYYGINVEYYSKGVEDGIYSGIKYIEIQDSDECIEDIINKIDLSKLINNQYVCVGMWVWNEEYEQNQFKLEKAYRYINGYLENARMPRLGEKLNDCFRDNTEQKLVYDALNSDNIDILIMFGDAGTGKDFSVLANCLYSINQPSQNKKGKYKSRSILYTRNIIESGEKLGFLPGNEYEKCSPYMSPARQNINKILETIGLNDDFETLLKDKKYVEYPLSYMRGCTFENTYMIYDECANASIDDLKMFISRAGENSKVVILGSLNQIDNKNNSYSDNGLYKLIEKYMGQKNCAVIKLTNQQRSYLARQADELLK